nr:MAG TPA: hypothetical protein [Caudoviricetes sp.]
MSVVLKNRKSAEIAWLFVGQVFGQGIGQDRRMKCKKTKSKRN